MYTASIHMVRTVDECSTRARIRPLINERETSSISVYRHVDVSNPFPAHLFGLSVGFRFD